MYAQSRCCVYQRFESTYKELKQYDPEDPDSINLGFESTYKELKLNNIPQFGDEFRARFESTYKELKHI